MSKREVNQILSVLDNEKHKAILFTTYSAGLRVSEVVRLKCEDIDSDRMLIRVREGKGKKARYTLLSETCLKQLRKYYKKYLPGKWLFPGHKSSKTTEIYTQVSKKDISNIVNPLDKL
ncbi:MAG: tyrosine-type recombinase/integrase [Bacillota bacterium]